MVTVGLKLINLKQKKSFGHYNRTQTKYLSDNLAGNMEQIYANKISTDQMHDKEEVITHKQKGLFQE